MSKKYKVLLVESDPFQRRLMAMLLEEMEACLFTAADGEEGLALALEQEPDVILLELFLPSLSGLEFLRRYRENGGRAGVLAFSAVATEDTARQALAAGADLFFSKPFRWTEVKRAVQALAERQ